MADPDPDVTRIYFFEVGATDGLAVYKWHFEEPVEKGKHQERITAVAKGGKLPWDPSDLQRPRSPLSGLDIYAASDEVCAYAFRLNATDPEGKQRLLFAEPPFVNLPLHDSAGKDFVTEFKSYPENGATGRWASFVCRLGDVRQSSLATEVRKLPEDHRGVLKIPLWFNFVDPELKGSPWVITTDDHLGERTRLDEDDRDDSGRHHGGDHDRDHDYDHDRDHDHGSDHDHEFRARRHRDRTHGGVHPLALANLVVEL